MSSSLSSLEDWTRRPIVKMVPTMVGRHVRIDPFDSEKDVNLLWNAFTSPHISTTTTHNEEDSLSLQTKTVDEYLRWILEFFKMESFENIDGFQQFLHRIHTDPTNALLVFRLIDHNGGSSTIVDDHDTDKNNQYVCGFAVYCYNSPDDGVVEIGIAHGHAMAQTVASTEVHYLLARYIFEDLKYRRYEWKCDKFNIKSNKAADRLGFRYEGCFRQSFVVPDNSGGSSEVSSADNKNKKKRRLKSRDTNWYSMLDYEWPDCKNAFEQWLDESNFDLKTGRQKNRIQDFQRWRGQKEMEEKKEDEHSGERERVD